MSVANHGTVSRTPNSAKLVVAALALTAAGMIVFLDIYRTLEVILAESLVGMLSSYGTYVDADSQTFYFGLGGDDPLGLHMTAECTSALLILPLIVVGAAMIWLRPRITRRVLTSLAIAAATLIMVNQLRLLLIVGLVDWFGSSTGYYWGHTMLGSMVSVFGGAIALVLFVWISTRGSRTTRTDDPDTGTQQSS